MNRREQSRIYRKAKAPAGPVKAKSKTFAEGTTRQAAQGINPLLRLAVLEHSASQLRKGALSHTMFARRKTALARQLHQDYGNGTVQRLVKQIEGQGTSGIQTRMMVGAAGDRYEREADRVARAVVAFLSVHRGNPAQRLREENKTLRKKPASRMGVPAEGGMIEGDVERAIRNARGGGRSLPVTLRAEMERAFGAEFSRVRVHTGPTPDALNRLLGSAAFTTGSDIFFRRSHFRPGSRYGLEILAHELTHVIQQGHASPRKSGK